MTASTINKLRPNDYLALRDEFDRVRHDVRLLEMACVAIHANWDRDQGNALVQHAQRIGDALKSLGERLDAQMRTAA